MPSRRKRPVRGPTRTRPRHRAGTEQALIQAVGGVLADEGASALSASTVARRVGVDKALIYRYFGSFDALLDAYVQGSIYWPTPTDVAGDVEALLAMPFGRRFATVMRRYAGALRARPDTLAILAAELSDRAAFPAVFHAALEDRREAFGHELFKLAHDAPAGVDVHALATLMTGSIHYLLIRARQVALFNGIPLGTDEGWARVEENIERTILGAVAAGQDRTTASPGRSSRT